MKKKIKKQELVEQNYILAENVWIAFIDDIYYFSLIKLLILKSILLRKLRRIF